MTDNIKAPKQVVTGRLENWFPVAAHTEGHIVVWGEIYDDVHERWLDGHQVRTSYFPERPLKEGDLIKTLNSLYLLGQPIVANVGKENDG